LIPHPEVKDVHNQIDEARKNLEEKKTLLRNVTLALERERKIQEADTR
jgi:heme exporter protein D